MTPHRACGTAHPAHAQRGGLRGVGRAVARAAREPRDRCPAFSCEAHRHARAARRVARGSAAARRLARAHVAARRRGVRGAARPARALPQVAVVGAATAAAARAPARPRGSRRPRRHGRRARGGRSSQTATSPPGRTSCSRSRRTPGDALERTLAAAGARCMRLRRLSHRARPAAPRRRALSSLGADNVVLASPSRGRGFVHQIDVDYAVPRSTRSGRRRRRPRALPDSP